MIIKNMNKPLHDVYSMTHPFISIIIPTYNREICLVETVRSLLKQNYAAFEIVIIDQSEIISEAKKKLIGEAGIRLRFYHIKERGRSLAKNYGILVSKGDIVLFCDDDILLEPHFLQTHAAIYAKDPTIAAASCRVVEEGDPSINIAVPLKITCYGKLVNKPYSKWSGYVSSLNGGNMSFKYKVLKEIGFFEEAFDGTSMVEEPDMAYRIIKRGYRIYFDASTTVQHFPQKNGNLAYMRSKRDEWFYYFFYNLFLFYTKYGRMTTLPFVFTYSILVCTKHVVKYKMSVTFYARMMNGVFKGIKEGLRLYRQQKMNPYFCPYRQEKYTITEMS
jgi:glycosyltransferase involved in cell wall biosynthesis